MKKYLQTIKNCPLFNNIDESEIIPLLGCLNAEKKDYQKDEFIFLTGEAIEKIAIILDGEVHIIKEDYWGNRTIITSIQKNNLFGEALSCSENNISHISALSIKKSTILFVDYKKIITTCSSACIFHTKLIENMIRILATKNIYLTKKIDSLTQKTTKEKILSYLSSVALEKNSNEFELIFNREQLANYLAVDRSALSKTLSQMQDDQILKFNKNKFKLL